MVGAVLTGSNHVDGSGEGDGLDVQAGLPKFLAVEAVAPAQNREVFSLVGAARWECAVGNAKHERASAGFVEFRFAKQRFSALLIDIAVGKFPAIDVRVIGDVLADAVGDQIVLVEEHEVGGVKLTSRHQPEVNLRPLVAMVAGLEFLSCRRRVVGVDDAHPAIEVSGVERGFVADKNAVDLDVTGLGQCRRHGTFYQTTDALPIRGDLLRADGCDEDEPHGLRCDQTPPTAVAPQSVERGRVAELPI